eukprot:XP_011607425.1 PREDICTED: general transcription factor II-I repeat domain-containing protein 2-like [Takifugu rubripes]
MSVDIMRPNIRATHRTPVLNEHRKLSKWQLACKFNNRFFFHANKIQKKATVASYEVAKLIAQHGNPFADGEFMKQCLMKVAETMCPEKVQDFNNVSLSRNTVLRRIEDLSANLKDQLKDKVCTFYFYSIACDESTDATDTAQLFIFLRGVDDNFCCTEELLDMMSLKGTTTGKDIFEAVSDAVEKTGLKWDKLCGVTTDGAPAMTGERKGMASMVCAKVKESGEIKLFLTPFLVDAEEVEEGLQLELIEMQCDDSLKSQYQLLSLPDFYRSLDNTKFPQMRRHAKRMMSLFGSTYICEQAFSLLNQNKGRLRARMTDGHLCEVLRVSTTKLSPDMSAILQSKAQHQGSH